MAGQVSGKLKLQAGSTRNNRDQAFPEEDWWQLYGSILKETDPEGKVEGVLDRELLGEKCLGVHHNSNRATVWLSCDDLLKVLH